MPAPRPPSFALFPFLAAGLVVVLGLQVVRWAYEEHWFAPLWRDLLEMRPERALPNVTRRSLPVAQPAQGYLAPYRATIPVEPFNLQFGNASSPLTLTIFTDPACGPCRARVREVLEAVPLDKLRLVYKFLPERSQAIHGGIFLEIARRQGVVPPLMKALGQTDDMLPEADFAMLLERVGVKLDVQRAQLAGQSADILANLGKDMEAAQRVGLKEAPQFFLNDYFLDGEILSADHLGDYMARLEKGESVLQESDYWMGMKE